MQILTLILSLFINASISLFGKLLSESLFEDVLRRITFHTLNKVVKSTKNKVDDDIVKPILEKLKNP